MMLKISDWMRVLREHLHIAPIEAKIMVIEAKVTAIEAKVTAIDDALESAIINFAKTQALLTNEQKHLEVILTEIGNKSCQLIVAIESDRRHREETKIQIMAEIAAMKNEMQRVADIVDQQIQPTHIQ